MIKWFNGVLVWAGIMLAAAMFFWCGYYLVNYHATARVGDWVMFGYGLLVSGWLIAKATGRITVLSNTLACKAYPKARPPMPPKPQK